MALPFTVEQFFGVFRAYNTAIWPAQVAAYSLAAFVVVLMLRRSAVGDRIVAAVLAGFWLWTGIAYHTVYFSRINKAAYAFGALFVIEGLLLLVFGTVRPRGSFRFRVGIWSLIGAALVLYAAVIYPLLGVLFGHLLVEIPWLGVTPCPTTIFTLGVFLSAVGRRLAVLAIPLLWSVVGGNAAVLLQVPQDYGLIAAGILGLLHLLMRARPTARDTI